MIQIHHDCQIPVLLLHCSVLPKLYFLMYQDIRTYIHLDGNSLVLNTQESSMFSNAIKNSGAKITTVEDTDYLTWKKDENYDVQEKAKENHMKAVLDEGAKKINGEK